MAKIYDISMSLEPGMLVYPGTPPFELEQYRKICQGDSSNNSKFSMGCHVGTHVDAPSHYVDGSAAMESLDPEVLIGPCRVFRLSGKVIDADSLRHFDFYEVKRALFSTPSSEELTNPVFNTDFSHITSDGADFLIERGVRLVGIDYLSVDRYKAPGHPAHHKLLGEGVVIIEGVNLSGVSAGDYELICCPLKMTGAEAAPARVFLRIL